MTLFMAEFAGADPLVAAVHAAREQGHAPIDAYTPFAVEGLSEALGHRPSQVRRVMFVAGAIGAASGYLLQYWSAVDAYPINSGGRPLDSWPAFMLVVFELAVLFAALAGFAAFLYGARLTRLNAPIFDVPGFERASSDGFFLELATDNGEAARRMLEAAGAMRILEAES